MLPTPTDSNPFRMLWNSDGGRCQTVGNVQWNWNDYILGGIFRVGNFISWSPSLKAEAQNTDDASFLSVCLCVCLFLSKNMKHGWMTLTPVVNYQISETRSKCIMTSMNRCQAIFHLSFFLIHELTLLGSSCNLGKGDASLQEKEKLY